MIKSKDIIILVVSFIANLLSAYLFAIKLLDKTSLMIIISSFIVISVIISIQLKISELEKDVENLKIEQKKNSEKLKIYERLSKIEAGVSFLKNG